MRERQSISDQRIIHCLKTNYGIEVALLTFLPIGADRHASVYKAQATDLTSYFVKVKRGHQHDISVLLVQLLHDAGVQQVIPPIKTIHGAKTQRIEDFILPPLSLCEFGLAPTLPNDFFSSPFSIENGAPHAKPFGFVSQSPNFTKPNRSQYTLIVYPFIEGEDGFSRSLTDGQWMQLGRALRQVHETDLPPFIEAQVRRETYAPKWRTALRSLYAHIEAEPVDEIALKLVKFMRKNMLAIRRLVDRAEQLGQSLQDESPKFVLCHSDIHGGNVLLDGNDTIYIVDWDEPIMAPKERDLMFIGGGVANVWNKPHEEELFYQGYGKAEVNRVILAYYRHERIVEDIAILGQELLLTAAGGQDRPEMYKHFIDMFEPRGVVDIAFKTEEKK